MPTTPVLIVGMHRSGTSSLAGSLQQAGLEMGRVNEKAANNARGNRENRPFVVLNNEVLRDNGARWNRPPKGAAMWSAQRKAQRDDLLAAIRQDRPWGFKDPRTLLTIEGWLDTLPDAEIVGTFRHPAAVARSLEARSGFPFERGLNVWSDYNRRLLRLTKSRKVALISFDWSPERYMARMATICAGLNLPHHGVPSHFFDADLRTNASPQLPANRSSLLVLYEELLALAVSQEAN